MHSYLTLALLSLAPTATWENSYSQAQHVAAAQKKPMAVVFGPGPNASSKIVRGGSPTAQVDKLLSEHYVCVFVDTDTEHGKKLASAFDIRSSVGLVISDRAGGSQAFWHQGDMTNDNLVHYLTKYSAANVAVTYTETPNMGRTSYYPSQSTQTYAPATRTVNC